MTGWGDGVESPRRFDYQRLWILLGLFGVILLLWETPLMLPLQILVVLFHELSHGLAAFLTGGHMVMIQLGTDQSGICYTVGGWRFLVLSAGYLGSMFWGGAILVTASRSRKDPLISLIAGIFIIGLTLFFVRGLFGMVYGFCFGAALVISGRFASEGFNDLLLKTIGLTSILYALLDIKDDLILRTVSTSDASRMAQEFFGWPVMWGLVWIAISVGFACITLRRALRENA